MSEEEINEIFGIKQVSRFTITKIKTDFVQKFIDEFDYLVNAISEFIGLTKPDNNTSLSHFNPYIASLSVCCEYFDGKIHITNQQTFKETFNQINEFITKNELKFIKFNIHNKELMDIIDLVGHDIVKNKVMSNCKYEMFPKSVNYALLQIDPTLLIKFEPHESLIIRDLEVIETIKDSLLK